MASTFTDCILSALHEVGRVLDETHPSEYMLVHYFKLLRYRLGNLKMVVLSATKRGINLSPSSLLETEDLVRKIAEYVPFFDPFEDYSTALYWAFEDLSSLRKLMEELSAPLLDALSQSSSLPIDEVLEFISFSLENLENFQDLRVFCIPSALLDAVKALGEQVKFLKSLILIVIQRNIEPGKDLLAHSGAVAVDAAFLLFDDGISRQREGRIGLHENFVEEQKLEISTLMQMIKPIHPQVYKTYTEALSRSKLAPENEALIATQNLLSSLISILREELARTTHVLVPINKDQLQELYEGLVSLRKTILKQQPNKLDLKIKEDIVTVVCDAGVFICSFQHAHKETELSIVHELTEAIKIIQSNLREEDAIAPTTFKSQSTTHLAFVDFLLEKLMELTSNNDEPTAKNLAPTIQEELVFFRSFLEETVELPNDHQEQLQALRGRVLEATYRIEELIEYLLVGNLPDSASEPIFCTMKDISNIKTEIKAMKRPEINVLRVTAMHSHLGSTTPSVTKEIVGLQDQAKSIMNQLMRGSENLRIVAVVGMAGLGKTTLAEKVYNNESILYHFSVSAFTTVAQTFDKKGVLADILKQIDPGKYSLVNSKTSADDVAEMLWRSLRGKRYLVILDDIWEVEDWQQLRESFPNDSKGSRIIFTSRRHDVAPPDMLYEGKPFELRLLNAEESVDLLQSRLYKRCRDTLDLSYKQLPEHLKPCLLYFATFQEDEQVSVNRLLSLWMAEGFIRKVEMKRLSDVAEEYLNDLKAKDEQFLHFLEGGHDELSAFCEPRVLDLERIQLDGDIPSEIGQLVRLTYLGIRGIVREIPSSIGNLSNLETFVLINERSSDLLLPDSFWNLRKLKHFRVSRGDSFTWGVVLPVANLDNSSEFYELDTISGVDIPYDWVERVMKKFPNVRKLKFKLSRLQTPVEDIFKDWSENPIQTVVLDILTQLESLCVDSGVAGCGVELSLPTNLKQLTLGSFYLTEGILSGIGKLPNLEYLKLKEWSGCDDQFGCLEKLVLSHCRCLEEIPSCFETISTLQMIKVSYCSDTVTESVKKIKEVQADYGNSDLKIIIIRDIFAGDLYKSGEDEGVCALHDAIKALTEQMTFLKALIHFVVQRNTEPNKDWLAHVGAVVIEAAFFRFDDGFCQESSGALGLDKRVARKKILEISTLIQKIKNIHPQVCKTFTEALISTKLTTRLLPPADHGTESDAESLVATQNLLSSLVSILYRKLTQCGRVVDPNRDQLQELYEGLRSLRKSVTKQLPNKLDQKNIQGDIVSVVCDVAVFICSFQQSHDQEAGLICIVQQSSETIKKILSNLGVAEKDAQVTLFNSRSTTLLAFFDFLIEKLMELTSNNVELTAIQQELDSLRSLLGDIVEQPNDQGELQDLKGRILEVAYRVEDLIDHSLLVGSPQILFQNYLFLSEITFMKKPEIHEKKSTASQSQLVKSTSPSISTKEIVGFHDEATSIINRLKRGSKNLRVLAIVGMAGLGKTTLAEKVYNNESISYHFSVCAFTTVAQKFDKNGVLLDLIKQVDPGKYSKITSEANADDVAEQLWRSLKGKRYLIVLDDIWEAKAQQHLQASFPDDSKGVESFLQVVVMMLLLQRCTMKKITLN
ncbi:OLC1v1013476C1 [Oldenlandia corymbosa var. corymbosa]|uniref:OLC1v1013476C1 n=1 Tax=Oldenlandia corymbosa var. corymbosa TaxID=529605 RepID=A0AAV1DYN5_OLDCO|nr:OLC1v1013476C1 [Oldenlandia corymbosa var. corymbosa]